MPDPDREDRAALERIREICLELPGADEGQLQDRPLFRVGRRRFAIFNGLQAPPRPRWDASGRSLHFVTEPGERDALRQDGRFDASPHHWDKGWMAIRIETASAVDWDELGELLDSAYRHVAPQSLLGDCPVCQGEVRHLRYPII